LPRLIATDLDGTLLGHDHTVSRRNALALARASASGAVVVLVTGRPVRWLPMVYRQLDGPYPAICANGAATYDPASDAVHECGTLVPEVLAEVCTRLATAVPEVCFAVEIDGGRRMLHEPAWPVRFDVNDPGVSAVPLRELVGRPAVKLLARSRVHGPDEFTALVAATVADLVEPTHSSYTGLVEMSARGVTKATGLAALARARGIGPDEVLAFGDMPNDVPMLEWAGRSVVMANAHPAACAAADEVTLSNVDDGIAAYLEPLLAGCAGTWPRSVDRG
jgi:Cof subfamily protein (haloacid dehalogenase superfamily)